MSLKSIIATLEADGAAIIDWVMSETQKIVAVLKQDHGLVGFIVNVIDTLDGDEGAGLSGGEKMAALVERAVPEVIKVLTAGQSAVAVVETEIFDLARELGQSVYNDAKTQPSVKAIADALGIA